MKVVKVMQNIALSSIICLVCAFGAIAQETAPTPSPASAGKPEVKTEENASSETATEEKQIEKKEELKTEVKTPDAEVSETAQTADKKDDKNKNRQESLSEEEAAIIPYYNNYLSEYHLGPEDVISVDVFNQPAYSKAGINIPPTATIGYPLIPGGVFVGGKTLRQVELEITKKLEEYIIEPQVTVTLEKVGSARYSIVGDVAQPGVRLMTRRLNISEALMEAGGLLPTGSQSKITILRQTGGGYTQIPVDLKAIRAGKAENVYLTVGDQVVVPGNKIKTVNNVLSIISKLSAVRLLFGSPF